MRDVLQDLCDDYCNSATVFIILLAVVFAVCVEIFSAPRPIY